MKVWRTLPFLRLLIPFSFGIILSSVLPDIHLSTILLAVFFVVQILMTGATGHISYYRWQWIFGMALNIELMVLGIAIANSTKISSDPLNVRNQYLQGDQISACLDAPISETRSGFKSILSVQHIIRNNRIIPAHGKVLVYFQEDSPETHPPYGSIIRFGGKLTVIPFSGNPGVFNYRDYMRHKGVCLRTYIPKTKFQCNGTKNNIKILSCLWRDKALTIIRHSGLDKTSAGILSALLLGDKSGLDPQLKQSFGRAGASHILAVSGLHVGIIYLILALILKPLSGNQSGKVVSVLTTIILLWFYAFLTGLQPSVCRAVIMFSFVRTGALFNRSAHALNILASSAFFTLAVCPAWIFDPGFQLSYTAVAGILVLQSPIYRIFSFENGLADRLWALSSVSLSAQIGTFPIVLYYFHQFPVYFFLSNLIVIPLCAVIIYGGIAMIVMSWWTWMYHSIAWLVGKSIWMMCTGVGCIERIPGSVIVGLHPDITTVAGIYIAVIVTLKWLFIPKYKLLIIALLSWIILSGSGLYQKYRMYYTHNIIAYKLTHGKAISLSYRGKSWLAMDTTASNDHKQYLYQILPGKTDDRQNWGSDSVKVLSGNKDWKIVFDGHTVIYDQASLWSERGGSGRDHSNTFNCSSIRKNEPLILNWW